MTEYTKPSLFLPLIYLFMNTETCTHSNVNCSTITLVLCMNLSVRVCAFVKGRNAVRKPSGPLMSGIQKGGMGEQSLD